LINTNQYIPNFVKAIIASNTQKSKSSIITFPILKIDLHKYYNNKAIFLYYENLPLPNLEG